MTEAASDLRLTTCPQCGYDLRGLPLSHTCPECGFAYDARTILLRGKLHNAQAPLIAAVAMLVAAGVQWVVSGPFPAMILLVFAIGPAVQHARNRSRSSRLIGDDWQLLIRPEGVAVSNGPGDVTLTPWTQFDYVRLWRHFRFKLTMTQRLEPRRRLILSKSTVMRYSPVQQGPLRWSGGSVDHVDFVFDGDEATARQVVSTIERYRDAARPRPQRADAAPGAASG